jgi:hypothetical protein
MVQLLRLLCGALIGLFQSSARREAEILVLRQQINVLRRKSPKKPALNNADRLLFVWLSRLVPITLAALAVVSPETVIRWHHAGFRAYWRSRSARHHPPAKISLRSLQRRERKKNTAGRAARKHVQTNGRRRTFAAWRALTRRERLFATALLLAPGTVTLPLCNLIAGFGQTGSWDCIPSAGFYVALPVCAQGRDCEFRLRFYRIVRSSFATAAQPALSLWMRHVSLCKWLAPLPGAARI